MPRTMRLARRLLVMLSAGLLSSCDESTGSDGTLVIGVNPAGLTLAQGTTGSTASIPITRGGGFNGVVTLAVSGLPNGVFATITPSQAPASIVNAVVDVSAALFAVPGNYSITISATGDGVPRATASLQLTILPAPDFSITVGSPALAVTAGSSINTSVNVSRTNFAGAVEFALLGAPAGLTATFTPATTTGTASSITFNVDPAVTPASYPLAIQGLAAGIGSRTANLQLQVLPQPGAFTVTPTPGSLILQRGNGAVINLAIARTDFTGPVTLAFENPSPGITGTIAPSSTTGDVATFTFNVGETVSAGIYQVRIRASSPGYVDRVAFISVTVTVPVGGAVEYLYCDPASVPLFFAYQDGIGAWRALTPTATGAVTRFAFTLVQDRGGVLAVTRTSTTPDVYHTSVVYASTAELAQDGFQNCQRTQPRKTVFATLLGVSAGELGFVSLGTPSVVFHGSSSSNPVTITGVPDGALDLLAARQVPGNAPNRLVVQRGLLMAAGGTIPAPIDFSNPPSLTPALATATLTGAGFDLLDLAVSLSTANSLGQLWFDLSANSSSSRQWGGLATVDMLPGDLHGLTATARPTVGAAGDARVAGRYIGPVSNQTIAFGPVLNLPTVQQLVAGSYPRYKMTGSLQAEYDKGVSIDIKPRTGPGNTYRMVASRAWLASFGDPQAYDVAVPDVASLAGFVPAARLTAGPNDALVTGFGFTGQGIFAARPALGVEFRMASRGFTIQVP